MRSLRRFYVAAVTAVLLGWAAVAFRGFEPFAAAEKRLPPEARAGAGPRTFHFWHSGYHGGK